MKKLFTFILLINSVSMHAKTDIMEHLERYISSNNGRITLDLAHKKLKKLPDDLSEIIKRAMAKVDVKKKPVTDIDFSSAHLKGKIASGTFKGLNNITHINLNNNQITEVESGAFQDLRSLEWIYLSNNKITDLQPGTFDDLTGLWGLVLSGNKISNFGPAVLEELRLLYELDLSNNKIKTLTTAMFAASDAARKVTTDVKVDGKKVTQRETKISNLQVINFKNNPIKKVEPDVFAGLPYLKQVIVSDNLSEDVMKALQESVKMIRDSLQKFLSANDKCQLVVVPNH